MSNPGVILLATQKRGKNKFDRFMIEDNIGEAIHLHIDNMRIDFSVSEYFEFSKLIRDALNELNILDGFKISDFDEHFLSECSQFLPNLERIKIEEIKLSQLKCLVHSNYGSLQDTIKCVTIDTTSAYNYLTGNKNDFIKYEQFNYHNVNNEKRINELCESIKMNGYPFENNHIILFGGQNIIRDGLHRAACVAYLNGMEYKVKVLRFYFTNDKYRINVRKNNLFVITKYLIKKILMRMSESKR